jgi:hypothetical protein
MRRHFQKLNLGSRLIGRGRYHKKLESGFIILRSVGRSLVTF